MKEKMKENWIASFQQWLTDNARRFEQDSIRVEMLGITPYTPSCIAANIIAPRHETTVELWETGKSEFHFLDWEAVEHDPEAGVVVTHHDFTQVEELYAALDQLINRMSPVLA